MMADAALVLEIFDGLYPFSRICDTKLPIFPSL
jgi:hypothetical protein